MDEHLHLATLRIEGIQVRRVRLAGRSHLVFPGVVLREQVLKCQNCEPGGEFIPLQEIEDSVPAWEGRPITIGHPKLNGEIVSAGTREVIDRGDHVGHVFGVRVEDGALKADFWLDEQAVGRVVGGQRVLEQLEAGEILEVSSGYYRRAERRKGTHGGRPYVLVQRRIIPDHVAILVGETGACSVDDGCGAPRANAEGESLSKRVRAVEDAVWARNRELGEKREDEWWWTVEVFEDAVIVRLGGRLHEVQYEIAEDGAVTFGERVPVEVEYRPVGNQKPGIGRRIAHGVRSAIDAMLGRRALDGAAGQDSGGEGAASHAAGAADGGTTMDRSKLIQELAANVAVGLKAEQLEKLSDEALTAMHKLATPPANTPNANACGCSGGDGAAGQADDGQPQAAEPPAANAASGALDVAASVIAALTSADGAAKLRAAMGLDDVVAEHAARKAAAEVERTALIDRLKANAKCPFQESELQALSVDALQRLEQSLRPGTFLGVGGPRFAAAAADDSIPAPPPVLLARPAANGAGQES